MTGVQTCALPISTTEHRVIVSKGPLADQITLHDNQVGEAFLPQPAILPPPVNRRTVARSSIRSPTE